MQRWLVNPTKLQTLREEAQLTPEELAPLIGCHPQHYRKLERQHQPSDRLGWKILNVLGRKLKRVIGIEDIATPKAVQERLAA